MILILLRRLRLKKIVTYYFCAMVFAGDVNHSYADQIIHIYVCSSIHSIQYFTFTENSEHGPSIKAISRLALPQWYYK